MALVAESLPPLRYLSSAELEACLPPIAEQIDLAERALVALASDDAEMPPKIGVHPREGALLHAMPAWLRSRDLVGLKWVSAFPGNKARGLPAISGLVVLNDPDTGLPLWVLDAARITAVRTAAVSGVAIRRLGRRDTRRVACLGAGVQARSHLDMIAATLREASVALFDRHPQRAAELAELANRDAGRSWVTPASSSAAAADGAQLIVTVATLGAPAERLDPASLVPGALVVAVDFATYAGPELANGARLFVVDDRSQFMHYCALGYFDGFREPDLMLGQLAGAAEGGDAEAVDGVGRGAPDDRPALVTHLGVGLADVVFADAICRRASEAGMGTRLVR